MTAPTSVILNVGGASTPTLVYDLPGPGPHPAVVLSPEAYGINEFTRDVASRLNAAGYVVVVPDYYRGNGLKEPDNYLDFSEVMEFIGNLDFVEATRDILAGIDHARSLSNVDGDRVAVWGYCTGSTLAMLSAAVDRRLAAAVIFFPSQPTFPVHDDRHPLDPIDVLWAVKCPIQFIYGDADEILVDLMPEVARRLTAWRIDHRIDVYPGAGHAFSAPVAPLRNDAADVASWADATAFLALHLQG
ncbi:MAG: dienelactone hydrolase family protein [Acidimicrobiia bacterium]